MDLVVILLSSTMTFETSANMDKKSMKWREIQFGDNGANSICWWKSYYLTESFKTSIIKGGIRQQAVVVTFSIVFNGNLAPAAKRWRVAAALLNRLLYLEMFQLFQLVVGSLCDYWGFSTGTWTALEMNYLQSRNEASPAGYKQAAVISRCPQPALLLLLKRACFETKFMSVLNIKLFFYFWTGRT